MKNLLAVLLFVPLSLLAAEGGYRLDRSPHDPHDVASLQSGARTYMNYCLGCHGMQFMRYDGLKHLGLTEAQIKDNLMFTAEKVGEPIKIAFNPKEAKSWFGVAPPDLSVIARSRGADWLYTYLRTFYRDDSRPKFEQLMSMLKQPHPDPATVGRTVLELKGIPEQARTKQSDFENQLSSILNPSQR